MTVLAFDRAARSWTSTIAGQAVAVVPPLDGALLTDEAALNDAAEDFGHLRHHRPVAVLEPGSRQDIVRMINFAREQDIKIGPRGQGHNTFGRSLVEGGIVIRMATLVEPLTFGPDWVEVSAGMTWGQVLQATLERGRRPRVLTSNPALSVGGTLSVGGIDGGSYRYGAQVDNVLELQVVTGEGRLERCSPARLPELFDAILAGQGQCGIIVRATLRLVPAETHTLFFQLLYRDLRTMLDDERLLVSDGRFDRISAYSLPKLGGGWIHYIQAARNFAPPLVPDENALLSGLHHIRGFEKIRILPYLEYTLRGVRYNEMLAAESRIDFLHPWFDAFLPSSALDDFAAEVLASLDGAQSQPDFPVEFYGLNADACTRPLLRLPEGPVVFLIDVLSSFAEAGSASERIAQNRRFFKQVQQVGGRVYPVNAIPLTPQEWREHYGPAWEGFRRAKRRFDPDNVMTPGPQIFEGATQ